MKYKATFFHKTYILMISVLTALAFLSSLAGCKPMSGNQDEAVYTLHGTLSFEDGYGNEVPVSSTRSAFPTVNASSYTTVVTAKCTTATKENVQVTFTGSTSYTIKLTAGTWKITAIGYESDAANPEFVSSTLKTVEVTVDEDTPNPTIPSIKMVTNTSGADSTGTVKLGIRVQSISNINYYEATWYDSNNVLQSHSADIANTSVFYFNMGSSGTAVPAGNYTVTFCFYISNGGKKTLKYSCIETVSVFSRMETSLWYAPNTDYISSNTMYISDALVQQFADYSYYVDPNEGNDDDNNGTENQPFKTFAKAYSTWKTAASVEPLQAYNIYIKSDKNTPYEEEIPVTVGQYVFSGKLKVVSYSQKTNDSNGLFKLKGTSLLTGDPIKIEVSGMGSTKINMRGIEIDGTSVIAAGKTGLAVIDSSAIASFVDCKFANSPVKGIVNSGTLTLENCQISKNAGGIHNQNGAVLTMSNCTVSENTDGGLFNSGTAYVVDGSFTSNTTTTVLGSAIDNENSSSGTAVLEVSGTVFTRNTSSLSNQRAATLYCSATGTALLSKATFTGNANFEGVVLSLGSLTLNGITIKDDNTKSDGTAGMAVFADSYLYLSGEFYVQENIRLGANKFITINGEITLAEGASPIPLDPTTTEVGTKVLKAETEAVLFAAIPKFALTNSLKLAPSDTDSTIGVISNANYVSGSNAKLLPAGSDTTGDGSFVKPYATLNKAVTAATAGSSVIIDGTVTETVGTTVNFNLTIKGINSDNTLDVVKRGSSMTTGSMITLSSNKTLTLKDITLDGDNVETNSSGAGINAQSSSNLTLKGVVIKNCKTSQDGGGIYLSTATFSMDADCKITGNSTTGTSTTGYGGGIYITASCSNVSLTAGEISSNSSSKNGGGVYVATGGNADLTLDGVTICGNTASTYGGGVYFEGAGHILYLDGGVIGDDSAISQATSTSFSNKAQKGGGIYLNNGTISTNSGKEGSVIAYNYATLEGGGIFVCSNPTTILKLGCKEIKNNLAKDSSSNATNGSGVRNCANSSSIIKKVVFADTDVMMLVANKTITINGDTASLAGTVINVSSDAASPTVGKDLAVFGSNYKNARYLHYAGSNTNGYIDSNGKYREKLSGEKLLTSLDGAPSDSAVYVLDRLEEFGEIKTLVENGNSLSGKSFKLNSNVALGTWTPIGTSSNPFSGTFDGNTKTISTAISLEGITLSGGESFGGIFAYTSSATIKNVKVEGTCQVSGGTDVGNPTFFGGIVGNASNTTIADCENGVNFSKKTEADLTGARVGGVVGLVDGGEVYGCKNTGTIFGDFSGGIAAVTTGANIYDCSNSGIVNVNGRGGGIVALFEGNDNDLYNCKNSMSIQLAANEPISMGGIVGEFYGREIYNCGNVGGITTNSKTVRTENFALGCVAGRVTLGNISNSYNHGTLSQESNVTYHSGGIAGYIDYDSTVFNCVHDSQDAYFGSTYTGGWIIGGVGSEYTVTLRNCYYKESDLNLSDKGCGTNYNSSVDSADVVEIGPNMDSSVLNSNISGQLKYRSWLKSGDYYVFSGE